MSDNLFNYFEKLPKPLIKLIIGYLNIEERARFGRTCRKYKIYAPGIDGLLKYHKKVVEIVNIVHLSSYADICRICLEFCTEISYNCEKCSLGTCVNCTDEMCELCKNKIKCTVCDNDAFAKCISCKEYKCNNHVEFFKVNALHCFKCQDLY